MQDSWLNKKAEAIQSFADRKDMKKFHDALKTIYGPKCFGATPLLTADGSTLLTDKDPILDRWTEHFNSGLNRPLSVMTMLSTDCHRQSAMFCLMNLQPSQKQGKQFNICFLVKHQVQMQLLLVYKSGELTMVEKLTALFQCMWRKEAIPQDSKDASIIHVYKRKGNP